MPKNNNSYVGEKRRRLSQNSDRDNHGAEKGDRKDKHPQRDRDVKRHDKDITKRIQKTVSKEDDPDHQKDL